jgi:hypothetical protein
MQYAISYAKADQCFDRTAFAKVVPGNMQYCKFPVPTHKSLTDIIKMRVFTTFRGRSLLGWESFDFETEYKKLNLLEALVYLALLNHSIRYAHVLRMVKLKKSNIDGEWRTIPHFDIKYSNDGIIVDDTWPLVKYGNVESKDLDFMLTFVQGLRIIRYKCPKINKKEKIVLLTQLNDPNYKPPGFNTLDVESDVSEDETEFSFTETVTSCTTVSIGDKDPLIDRFEISSDSDKDFG